MKLLEQTSEEFDRDEIAGMRSAGIILLISAAVTLLVFALTRTGLPMAAGVDVFLGVQFLRLRHSWRAWAMLRAGVGVVSGAVLVVVSVVSSSQPVSGALAWLGQVAYCSSLLLLLYGSPSSRRVWAGRLSFAGAAVITAAAAVVRDVVSELPAVAKTGFTSVDLLAWDVQERERGRISVQTALLWTHVEVPGSAGVYALVQARRKPVGDRKWHHDGYKEFPATPSAAEICDFLEALSASEADVRVLSREFNVNAWTRRTRERPPCEWQQ
jgi:hypothetical protein